MELESNAPMSPAMPMSVPLHGIKAAMTMGMRIWEIMEETWISEAVDFQISVEVEILEVADLIDKD